MESGGVTAVSYHDTVNVLQGLPFADRGPFARPEWFALLESRGARPFVALAREGAEALALPLVRVPGGLEGLSNWYAFTWSELATGDAARHDLLGRLARDLPAQASRITLSKLPDENGTATRLERAFREAGWVVLRERCDTNHVLSVAGRDFAEFLAGRPGALRTTLKRKARKVETAVLTSFSGPAWEAYEQVYAASWKPGEGDPALLRRFADGKPAVVLVAERLGECLRDVDTDGLDLDGRRRGDARPRPFRRRLCGRSARRP